MDVKGGGVIPPTSPLSTEISGQQFRDDVNGFSFTRDICFMHGSGQVSKYSKKSQETNDRDF
jgi:hypothetical protein